MKKVIRLTESDLYRIVKRVISEQDPPTGRTQTSQTNTTTATTRRTQDPTPRKKMNVYWHAEQIYKLLNGLRAQTNIFTKQPITLENIPENIQNVFKKTSELDQKIKNFLNDKYLVPLGKLVDPSDGNPTKLALQLLDAYSIKNPNLFPNKELVYKIGETPVGKRLMARIAQVKNQDVPN